MYGIYAITNIEAYPEKSYFGQSNDITRRLREHRRDLIAKKHKNPILQNAWNKYGKTSFIFAPFRVLVPGEDLVYWENLSIEEAKNLGFDVYNIRKPELRAPLSKETKLKMSLTRKGKFFSEEHKKSLSKAKLGNKSKLGTTSSFETKRKQSETQKGKQYALGKKHSVEANREKSVFMKKVWEKRKQESRIEISNKEK